MLRTGICFCLFGLLTSQSFAVTVDFDDPVPPTTTMQVWQGLDFLGQWELSGPYNVDTTNNVWAPGGSAGIVVNGRLNGLNVYTVANCTLTLSDGVNPSYSQFLTTGSLQYVEPGWGEDSGLVSMTGCGPDLGISAITFNEAPGLAVCDEATLPAATGSFAAGVVADFEAGCGGEVYFANRSNNAVERWNVLTQQLLATYALSAPPADLEYDESTGRLYAALDGVSSYAVVDTISGNVDYVAVADPVASIAAGVGGDVYISVGTGFYNDLFRVDDTGAQFGPWELNASAIRYDDTNNQIISATERLSPATLYRYGFDAQGDAVELESLRTDGGNGRALAVSADGQRLALAAGGGNGPGYTIYNYSSTDLTVSSGEWNTGPYPSGVAFSPDSRLVAASNFDELIVFDVNTHVELFRQTLPACSSSSVNEVGFSLGGALVYVKQTCAGDLAELYFFPAPAPYEPPPAPPGPPPVTGGAGTVDFDNPEPFQSPLVLWEGIDFFGQWQISGPYGADPSNHVWSNLAAPSFGLNRILVSLQVYSLQTCELTISDGINTSVSQTITPGSMQDVVTGWSEPSVTVALSGCGANLGLSAITSADTLDVGFEACTVDSPVVSTTFGFFSTGRSGGYEPLCDGEILVGNQVLNQVERVNLLTGNTAEVYPLNAAPTDFEYDELTGRLYVGLAGATRYAVIDTVSNDIQYRPATGIVRYLSAGLDGDVYLSAGDRRNNTLFRVDDEGNQTGAWSIIGNGIRYNESRNEIVTATFGVSPASLTRYGFDPQGELIGLQSLFTGGGNGQSLELSNDGDSIVMAAGGGNGLGYTVFDFSAADLNVVAGEWTLGAYPSGLAFSPNDSLVVGSNGDDMILFDANTYVELARQAIPSCPLGEIEGVSFSRGGQLAFVKQTCGIEDDSVNVYFWRLP